MAGGTAVVAKSIVVIVGVHLLSKTSPVISSVRSASMLPNLSMEKPAFRSVLNILRAIFLLRNSLFYGNMTQ